MAVLGTAAADRRAYVQNHFELAVASMIEFGGNLPLVTPGRADGRARGKRAQRRRWSTAGGAARHRTGDSCRACRDDAAAHGHARRSAQRLAPSTSSVPRSMRAVPPGEGEGLIARSRSPTRHAGLVRACARRRFAYRLGSPLDMRLPFPAESRMAPWTNRQGLGEGGAGRDHADAIRRHHQRNRQHGGQLVTSTLSTRSRRREHIHSRRTRPPTSNTARRRATSRSPCRHGARGAVISRIRSCPTRHRRAPRAADGRFKAGRGRDIDFRVSVMRACCRTPCFVSRQAAAFRHLHG